MPGPRPMKTWRCTGSVPVTAGSFDRQELSTGTSRQPRSVWPSSAMASAAIFSMAARDVGVLRHEDEADAVLAGLRQGEAQALRLGGEKRVRNLHQHAGAVADQRVGAGGAAMGEVLDDLETVLDDAV